MSPPVFRNSPVVRRPLLRSLTGLYHRGRNYQTIPTAFLEDDEVRVQYTRASCPSRRWQDITPEQEGFFNLLSHVQGTRIDEQRCNIQIVHNKGGVGSPDLEEQKSNSPPPEMNVLMDMLAHSQSRRLDDQRADFTYVPSCPNPDSNSASRSNNNGTAISKK